jgi:hypothetical protein
LLPQDQEGDVDIDVVLDNWKNAIGTVDIFADHQELLQEVSKVCLDEYRNQQEKSLQEAMEAILEVYVRCISDEHLGELENQYNNRVGRDASDLRLPSGISDEDEEDTKGEPFDGFLVKSDEPDRAVSVVEGILAQIMQGNEEGKKASKKFAAVLFAGFTSSLPLEESNLNRESLSEATHAVFNALQVVGADIETIAQNPERTASVLQGIQFDKIFPFQGNQQQECGQLLQFYFDLCNSFSSAPIQEYLNDLRDLRDLIRLLQGTDVELHYVPVHDRDIQEDNNAIWGNNGYPSSAVGHMLDIQPPTVIYLSRQAGIASTVLNAFNQHVRGSMLPNEPNYQIPLFMKAKRTDFNHDAIGGPYAFPVLNESVYAFSDDVVSLVQNELAEHRNLPHNLFLLWAVSLFVNDMDTFGHDGGRGNDPEELENLLSDCGFPQWPRGNDRRRNMTFVTYLRKCWNSPLRHRGQNQKPTLSHWDNIWLSKMANCIRLYILEDQELDALKVQNLDITNALRGLVQPNCYPRLFDGLGLAPRRWEGSVRNEHGAQINCQNVNVYLNDAWRFCFAGNNEGTLLFPPVNWMR